MARQIADLTVRHFGAQRVTSSRTHYGSLLAARTRWRIPKRWGAW
jgi:hypothetical protein